MAMLNNQRVILMVIIWLMMVNHNLVGGWLSPTPLKNHGMSESQLG